MKIRTANNSSNGKLRVAPTASFDSQIHIDEQSIAPSTAAEVLVTTSGKAKVFCKVFSDSQTSFLNKTEATTHL